MDVMRTQTGELFNIVDRKADPLPALAEICADLLEDGLLTVRHFLLNGFGKILFVMPNDIGGLFWR